MPRRAFEPGMRAISDFRATWPRLLVVSLVTRVVAAVVLLPGVALLLRFFLARQGRDVLSDQEILYFFLTPVGAVALVVVGGLWIGIALLEQAGLMVVGFGTARDLRISWLEALRHVTRRASPVLRLGSYLLVRAVLLSAPILVLIVLVYRALLGEHDINYYLTARPPEFWWAAGIAAALLALLAVVLTSRVLAWVLALPAVLFEDLGPRDAVRDAVADSRGHRWELLGWISGWIVAGLAVSVATGWALGLAGRLAVSWAGGSLSVVALSMGAIGVASLVSNAVLSFLSAALIALLLTRVYDGASGPPSPPPELIGTAPRTSRGVIRVSGRGVLVAGALAVVASSAAAAALVRSLRPGEGVRIIAHRGASSHAPENTLASMRRAIADSADFLEIDVQETADGEVVVFHDSDFMRTARTPLGIRDARRVDLERLDVGSWFDPAFADQRVPTLEDVLLLARDRTGVVIELKYYGHDTDLERRVVEIVERTDMQGQSVIMSLEYDGLRKMRALRPDWTYGLLTSVHLGDPTRFEVDFLAVNAAAATRGFIDRAHRQGLEVYAWTVNDPYLMSALMSRNVDGLITDDPAVAREVVSIRAAMDPVQRLLVGIGAELGVFSMPESEIRTEVADG